MGIDTEQEKKDSRGWAIFAALITIGTLIYDVYMAAKGRITLSETGGWGVNRHPWIAFGLSLVLGHICMQRSLNIIKPSWLESVLAFTAVAIFAVAWELYRAYGTTPLFVPNWWQMYILINIGLLWGSFLFSMSFQGT